MEGVEPAGCAASEWVSVGWISSYWSSAASLFPTMSSLFSPCTRLVQTLVFIFSSTSAGWSELYDLPPRQRKNYRVFTVNLRVQSSGCVCCIIKGLKRLVENFTATWHKIYTDKFQHGKYLGGRRCKSILEPLVSSYTSRTPWTPWNPHAHLEPLAPWVAPCISWATWTPWYLMHTWNHMHPW